jgi:hypothetical protein
MISEILTSQSPIRNLGFTRIVFLAFFLFLNFFLLQCAAGNAYLKVHPDASADLQFVKKELNASLSDRSRGSLSNLPSRESKMTLTSLETRIPSINDFHLSGADFILSEDKHEDGIRYCLLFTLNTAKNAGWFEYFQITRASLDLFQKESETRDDLARFNNTLDLFVWEITMPGDILSVRDYEPLGPEWWISNHSGRKAILKIPAKDVLSSRRKFSTYEVCSLLRHKTK